MSYESVNIKSTLEKLIEKIKNEEFDDIEEIAVADGLFTIYCNDLFRSVLTASKIGKNYLSAWKPLARKFYSIENPEEKGDLLNNNPFEEHGKEILEYCQNNSSNEEGFYKLLKEKLGLEKIVAELESELKTFI